MSASKPPAHRASWPAWLYRKSRNSCAEAGLAAFFVTAMPRGISGVASCRNVKLASPLLEF